MNIRERHFIVTIILAGLLLQGCATGRMDRHQKAAVAVLQQRSDADSLAAAALVLRFAAAKPDNRGAIELLGRAVSVAPERADLAWLEIQVCGNVPDCHAEAEELHLRELDPSNSAAWMDALARADASHDEAAKRLVLAGMARTERLDIYWTTLIVHLTHALVDTGKIRLDEAFVTAIGIVSAQAIPTYGATSRLCKGDRLDDADVREQCRHVASAFERGDAVITEMIGLVIAQRVWPADSPQWKSAAEQRRVAKYRMYTASQAEVGSGHGRRWAEDHLRLCEQNRREQDVVLAEITQAGKSPDPPADWSAP